MRSSKMERVPERSCKNRIGKWSGYDDKCVNVFQSLSFDIQSVLSSSLPVSLPLWPFLPDFAFPLPPIHLNPSSQRQPTPTPC